MLTKLLKEPSPHKLILFVRGKQLCSLRRTWTKICSFVRFIVFGSILVPSLLCLPSALKTRGFFFFFFCCLSSVGLYGALQPFGHLWFLPKTGFNQLVLRIEHLLHLSSFLSLSLRLPPGPIPSPPSVSLRTNILLDRLRFSIYGWAHNEGHCCNGSHQEIAAVALWLGCCQL